MAGRLVVVSAIFGGRDTPIRPPSSIDVDDWVMFTDGPDAPGWITVRADAGPTPRMAARRVKTLAVELVDPGDTVLWIDGRIRPTGRPLRPFLDAAMTGTDIAGYPHPWRSCAYDEARECAALDLAPSADLEAQTARYEDEGFPVRAGLWNTMVLARRRTPEMIALGREWWSEIQRGSIRDQVSLPYVLWQHGITCGVLGKDVYREGSSRHFVRGWHASAAA